MDPQGKVAVVTGGASGIGRALALALAAAGARGVVVGDLDEDGAAATALDIEGGRAIGAGSDAADGDALDALLGLAEDAFGPPDIFCANAGIGTGAGLEAPEETWEKALDVNLRAHVLAAQRVVPGWLARGGGHFLVTASAAGLLTQIGDAPYAVTKHAAVAFAEWLAVTYGGRGVEVSCLCPMGVDTPLLRGPSLAIKAITSGGAVLSAEAVAAAAIAGMKAGEFLILPHPEVAEFARRRAADPDRWIAGMQRYRESLG